MCGNFEIYERQQGQTESRVWEQQKMHLLFALQLHDDE